MLLLSLVKKKKKGNKRKVFSCFINTCYLPTTSETLCNQFNCLFCFSYTTSSPLSYLNHMGNENIISDLKLMTYWCTCRMSFNCYLVPVCITAMTLTTTDCICQTVYISIQHNCYVRRINVVCAWVMPFIYLFFFLRREM